MPIYPVSGSGAGCKPVVAILEWFDSICRHLKVGMETLNPFLLVKRPKIKRIKGEQND